MFDAKELLEQAKKHPVLVALSLFACLVVGALGGAMYVHNSEMRVSVLGEKVDLLSERDRQQKKINTVVMGQLSILRDGYSRLPDSLGRAKGAFEAIAAERNLKKNAKDRIRTTIAALDTSATTVQTALDKTEALARTFEDFLKVSGALDIPSLLESTSEVATAAKNGDYVAQYALARKYFTGIGVEKSYEQAIRWYGIASRTCRAGEPDASHSGPSMFEGISCDPVWALAWLDLQRRKGGGTSDSLMEAFRKRLDLDAQLDAWELTGEMHSLEDSSYKVFVDDNEIRLEPTPERATSSRPKSEAGGERKPGEPKPNGQ
jgi:hypothetical protein